MDESIKIAQGLKEGDIKHIGRAITLVESHAPAHQALANQLLAEIEAAPSRAVKIGISGAPGVGKSTLIEALGLELISQGKRVAVIAVDPSSPISHGSLLGDKTRMPKLSKDARAFIRPSPSRGTLGGLAPNTKKVIRVLDAALFDVVIIETVGVGQSEIEVASLVDTFVLLIAPAAGDELQGVKKGIVELANILAVTKYDGDLKIQAEKTKNEYRRALSGKAKRPGKWQVPVLLLSSVSGEGVQELWRTALEHALLSRQ